MKYYYIIIIKKYYPHTHQTVMALIAIITMSPILNTVVQYCQETYT